MTKPTAAQEILFQAALEMAKPRSLLAMAILSNDLEDARTQLESIEQSARVALLELDQLKTQTKA